MEAERRLRHLDQIERLGPSASELGRVSYPASTWRHCSMGTGLQKWASSGRPTPRAGDKPRPGGYVLDGVPAEMARARDEKRRVMMPPSSANKIAKSEWPVVKKSARSVGLATLGGSMYADPLPGTVA